MNLMERLAEHDDNFRARLNKVQGERERDEFYADLSAIRERERRKEHSLYAKLYRFVSHAYQMYKGGEY